MKKCNKCGESRDQKDFWVDKSKRDGLHTICIHCQKKTPRKKADPAYHRQYKLKKDYGLTIEQYNELLERQGGSCAVCDKTPEENKIALAVDHSHKTGKIRGLLCTYCNHRLVGKHEDSAVLRKIADYLDQDTGLSVPPDKVKGRRRSKKRKKRGKT